MLEIFDSSGKLIPWSGRLINFSMSGACFAARQVLAKGDRLSARLRLLNKGALDISAHVVWCRKKENTNLYGIQFDSVKNARPAGEP
ncbi:MAG: hypothetical protein A2X28_01745 [Elusimicrobia bacterium GWA2_56_46]|nr:MAG: hypothetical protein A2X28_01745 [Elusimicrobia bacterium GWA2_56_46]OGR53879.1 MAG: hypothetical protein A2X39_07145 [Elusimicrobia bacterium GWC2_56_31]